jgi:hypothetical protein
MRAGGLVNLAAAVIRFTGSVCQHLSSFEKLFDELRAPENSRRAIAFGRPFSLNGIRW